MDAASHEKGHRSELSTLTIHQSPLSTAGRSLLASVEITQRAGLPTPPCYTALFSPYPHHVPAAPWPRYDYVLHHPHPFCNEMKAWGGRAADKLRWKRRPETPAHMHPGPGWLVAMRDGSQPMWPEWTLTRRKWATDFCSLVSTRAGTTLGVPLSDHKGLGPRSRLGIQTSP
jgi:hypothetical protein